jgi:heparosan-N-sulfate-glucuronate 5-epimerase
MRLSHTLEAAVILNAYTALLHHWTEMVRGRSYWHQAQGMGMYYRPGALLGYYNDLTAKADWRGPTDGEGVPLVSINSSGLLYFPVTIFHKGLAHHDLWLGSGRTDQRQWNSFLALADWAVRNQEERGGWPFPIPMSANARYSALAQGEGISVLARAYAVTQKPQYAQSAIRAASLLLTPVTDGGTARPTEAGLVLEELPTEPPRTVLNGWISALYGLWDLQLTGCADVSQQLSDTLKALVSYLPRYDIGFWSLYDHAGTLASPFYHRLHIAQLQALEMTFTDHQSAFSDLRARFQSQLQSRANVARAVATKAVQKLWHLPQVVIG